MRRRRFIATVATATAVFALALHLLAVIGSAPIGMVVMFPVFLIGILSFFALVATLKRRSGQGGTSFASVVDLFEPIPNWGRVLFAAVFVYAGINFALFFAATGGGTIEQRSDGSHILSDHGRVIRVLDADGVREVETWQLRVFSGHILPFLVLPALYFWFAPRADKRPSDDISAAP